MLRIPLAALSRESVAKIAKALTLRLPDKGSYGFGTGGPETMRVYKVVGDYLCVPRNWPAVKDFEQRGEVLDQRSYGGSLDLTFKGVYRDGQKEFVSTLLEGLREDDRGVIGQAGCGFGKTVCATAAIAELGVTTLFVVHKEKLMKQFIEACEKFLNYTPGVIRTGTCDFRGKKICVGMIQSLHQKDYDPEPYRPFGLVMVDECHRVAAPTFSAAIERFHARYRVGLTATPRRGDRMEDIFFWHLGEVAAVGRGQFLDCKVTVVQWDPALKYGQWHYRGRPHLSRLITALSKEEARTNMLVRLIVKATRAGRKSLILSDRCDHLATMCARVLKIFRLAGESYTVGVFVAGASKKAQQRRDHALHADVMGGTWAMASEGLDVPERDTVFFATPKADVEQASGRIRRLYEGKKPPMIVDIDDDIGFLGGLARKRTKFYHSHGTDKRPWPIRVVSRIAS